MASGDGTKARLTRRKEVIIAIAILAAGWVAILMVNKWHVGAPVVFLCLGWFAVILCGRTLWGSAQAAAAEGTGSDEAGFELSSGRVVELEKEKRALLKAIKEVEFDREMGKMSDEDAAEISLVYRARAIDILKELEGTEGAPATEKLPLGRKIDREVRARLALAGVAARKPRAAATTAPGAPDAVSTDPSAAATPATDPSAAATPATDPSTATPATDPAATDPAATATPATDPSAAATPATEPAVTGPEAGAPAAPVDVAPSGSAATKRNKKGAARKKAARAEPASSDDADDTSGSRSTAGRASGAALHEREDA